MEEVTGQISSGLPPRSLRIINGLQSVIRWQEMEKLVDRLVQQDINAELLKVVEEVEDAALSSDKCWEKLGELKKRIQGEE